MPVDITKAVLKYVRTNLTNTPRIWDGEVLQQDGDGNIVFLPGSTPIITGKMPDQGFSRDYNLRVSEGGGGYVVNDQGVVVFNVYQTTKALVYATLNEIESLVEADPDSIANISFDEKDSAYIIAFYIDNWSVTQLETVRTKDGGMVYKGTFVVNVQIRDSI